jgi:hypothetical protein
VEGAAVLSTATPIPPLPAKVGFSAALPIKVKELCSPAMKGNDLLLGLLVFSFIFAFLV